MHTVSELKKGAIISDVELLTRNMHDMASEVQGDTYTMDRCVPHQSWWVGSWVGGWLAGCTCA